jgi:hypothetical protein
MGPGGGTLYVAEAGLGAGNATVGVKDGAGLSGSVTVIDGLRFGASHCPAHPDRLGVGRRW